MWKAVISHRENDLGFLLKCLIEDIEGNVIAKAEKQPNQMTKTELVNLIARANRIKEGGLRYNELKSKTKKELVSMAEKGITRMKIDRMRRGSSPNAYDKTDPLSFYPAALLITGMPKEIKDIDDEIEKLKDAFEKKAKKVYGHVSGSRRTRFPNRKLPVSTSRKNPVKEYGPESRLFAQNEYNIFPGYYTGKQVISEIYGDRQEKDRLKGEGLYATKQYRELKTLLDKRKKMMEDYKKEIKTFSEKGREYLKSYIENPTDEEFEKYIKNISDLGSSKFNLTGKLGDNLQAKMKEYGASEQIKRQQFLNQILNAKNKEYKKKDLDTFLGNLYGGSDWKKKKDAPKKILESIESQSKPSKNIKIENSKVLENVITFGDKEETLKELTELKKLVSENEALFKYLSESSEFVASSEKEIREALSQKEPRSAKGGRVKGSKGGTRTSIQFIHGRHKAVITRVLELLKLIAMDDKYDITAQKSAGNLFKKIETAYNKTQIKDTSKKLDIAEPKLGPRVTTQINPERGEPESEQRKSFEKRMGLAKIIELNAEIKEAKKNNQPAIVRTKARLLNAQWRRLTDRGLGKSLDSALNKLVEDTSDFYDDITKLLDVVDENVEESKEYNNIRRIRKAVAALMEKIRNDEGMEKVILSLFSQMTNKRRYDSYVRSNLFAYDGKQLEIVPANPKIFRELRGTSAVTSAANRLREVLIGPDAMRGKYYIDVVNEELGKKYKSMRVARYTMGVNERKKKKNREQKDSITANKNLESLRKSFLNPMSKLADDILPNLSGNIVKQFKEDLEKLLTTSELIVSSPSLSQENQEDFEKSYEGVSGFLKVNVGKGQMGEFIRASRKALRDRISSLDKEGTFDSPKQAEEREKDLAHLKEKAKETEAMLDRIEKKNPLKENKELYKNLSKLRRVVLSSGNVGLLRKMKILGNSADILKPDRRLRLDQKNPQAWEKYNALYDMQVYRATQKRLTNFGKLWKDYEKSMKKQKALDRQKASQKR